MILIMSWHTCLKTNPKYRQLHLTYTSADENANITVWLFSFPNSQVLSVHPITLNYMNQHRTF